LKTYDIYLGKEKTGQAHVRREGLYYHFQCACSLQTQTIYRVHLSVNGHRENLGILVPEGNSHTLSKRIPVKRLPEGEWNFQIAPRQEKMEGKFVPVYPDEPFAYIQRLQNAYLKHVRDQVGIMLQD
jgi:hypothetical protein